MPWRLYFLKNTFLHKYFYIIKSSYFRLICLFLKFFRRLESFWRHLEMPKSFKIKKTYAKDQRHDACLRKIAFFNYEMENNIIMGTLRVVHIYFIFEINVGKGRIRRRTTPNLNGVIFNRFWIDLDFIISDIDFKNKMTWDWTSRRGMHAFSWSSVKIILKVDKLMQKHSTKKVSAKSWMLKMFITCPSIIRRTVDR